MLIIQIAIKILLCSEPNFYAEVPIKGSRKFREMKVEDILKVEWSKISQARSKHNVSLTEFPKYSVKISFCSTSLLEPMQFDYRGQRRWDFEGATFQMAHSQLGICKCCGYERFIIEKLGSRWSSRTSWGSLLSSRSPSSSFHHRKLMQDCCSKFPSWGRTDCIMIHKHVGDVVVWYNIKRCFWFLEMKNRCRRFFSVYDMDCLKNPL